MSGREQQHQEQVTMIAVIKQLQQEDWIVKEEKNRELLKNKKLQVMQKMLQLCQKAKC